MDTYKLDNFIQVENNYVVLVLNIDYKLSVNQNRYISLIHPFMVYRFARLARYFFTFLFIIGFLMLFFFNEFYQVFILSFTNANELTNPQLKLVGMQMMFLFSIIWFKIIEYQPNVLKNIKVSSVRSVHQMSLGVISLIFIIFIFHCCSSSLTFLYQEDNFFEYFTFVITLLAGTLFGLVIYWTNNKWFKGVFAFLSLLFLVYAMEEISWGQRIFGWETSQTWKELNYQEETNIHNLFNPAARIIYLSINFLLSIFMLYAHSLKDKPILRKYSAIFPKEERWFYGLIFGYLMYQEFVIFPVGGEISEITWAITGFAYSIDFYLRSKNEQLRLAS